MKQLLKYILSNTIEYQKISETKHSITIALATSISLFDANFIHDNLVLSFIGIFLCLSAVIVSFIALTSHEAIFIRRKHPSAVNSLIFYRYIASLSEEEYGRLLVDKYSFPVGYKFDQFEKDLIQQITALSRRVYMKFVLFNVSVVTLGVGICLSVLATIV